MRFLFLPGYCTKRAGLRGRKPAPGAMKEAEAKLAEECENAEEVKSGLWNWNESKRRFGEHEVIAAINALSDK